MIFRSLILFITFISAVSFSNLLAQPGIYSEEEIQLEDKFLKGKIQFLLGKYDEAESIYMDVFKQNVQNHTVAFELSRVFAKKKDNANFEKYIKKAIQLDSSNPWYNRSYARYLEKQDRYEDALVYLDKLVSSDPRNGAYLNKSAEIATKALKYDKAIAMYNKIQAITGVDEKLSRKKFELYASSGDKQKAIKELRQLSNAFPKDTRYLNNLASYYTEIGKKKDAKKIYQKVIQLDENDPTAMMALSGNAQDKSEAAYLQSIAGLVSKSDITLDMKIMELIPYVSEIDKIDPDGAEALLANLDILENVHADDAKTYALYGDALMGLNRYGAAIPKYKKSLSLTKSVFPVWEQLMYALLSTKDYTELAKTADQALNYYPNQPICYYFLGQGIGLQIKPSMSKEDRFLKGISDADWYKGRKPLYTEAIDSFEEAMLMSGNNKPLKYRISVSAAQIAFNYGDYKKASFYANKASEQGQQIKNPQLESLLKDINDRLN